jgi:hypothetical protein
MNKKIYHISFALLTGLFASSCTGKYLDINTEPYVPGDVNADDYGLGAAMNNLAACVVSPDVNTCQFTDCLLGGPMGGYFADTKGDSDWPATISCYNAKDDWTRVFLQTDQLIPVLYTNLAVAKQVSEETNNPVPIAIGNIIKVATMHRITDTYGPIPYSKIGDDGAITAPYDSQQEVYNKFFEELDASIAVLMENQNRSLTPSADYIYGGNVKSWIKFANSLKLRLAIRIANVDPTTAKTMAESAVNNEVGVITANADNAKWDYFKVNGNPFYTATRYNMATHDDGTTCQTGGDAHAAADIICYMNGYNDPRREKYFTKSEWTDANGKAIDYVGSRRGIIAPANKVAGHKYSGVRVLQADPIYWMNAAEVAFLRAEGAAIYGFDMGGSAESFYDEGIRLSFEQYGVGGVDTYLNNSTGKPTTYTDPYGQNNYQNTISEITVKWDESASKDQKQERIITQKWIANWMLGNEAWADYRRTGYPHLIPASAAGNKSGGIVDSNRGARRMPWPADEYTNNAANMPAALQALGGADNMATDVWWAKKN